MNTSLPSRYAVAGQLLYLGACSLGTRHGEVLVHVAQNLATGAVAFAVTCGNVASPQPLLARVHSSCVTSETFGGCDCDCVEQLDAALAEITRARRGVIFYLLQEGRGAGFVAKARDRMIVQASGDRVTTFEAYAGMGLEHDLRSYEQVGFLCRLLGVVAPLTILTNNPVKLAALEGTAGVAIGGCVPLSRPPSPYNLHYIRSKSRSGHNLEDPGDRARAALPETVVAFEPRALVEDPRFLLVASYFLPVRVPAMDMDGGAPHWFRCYAYFDLATGRERVVLTYNDRDAGDPLVRLQRESLLERFPLAGGGANKSLWYDSIRRIVEHGSGIAAFVPPDGFDADLREMAGEAAPSARLLDHHLRGRRGHPLLFECESAGGGLDSLASSAAIARRSNGTDTPDGDAGTQPASQTLR